MLLFLVVLCVGAVCSWAAFYAGYVHGMTKMAEQLEDAAIENSNPDAND